MSDRELKNGSLGGNGDIFRSDLVNGVWSKPVDIGSSINTTSGEDEPTFSANGTEMYYQSWSGDWKKTGGPYYKAKLENGVWKKKGSIGTNISRFFADQSNLNFGYATDGMAVSPDGKIFIVACGPEYDGPMDLYYSIKKENGWTYPELFGVSTEGDERSVFIAGDSKTIYFSSDGLGGFGGLDIFKVQIQSNGKLGKPVNIGVPFNTSKDDMGFVASADGKSAFFIRNLDIYYADISMLNAEIKPESTQDVPKEKEIPTPKEKVKSEKLEVILYFEHDETIVLNSSELDKINEKYESIQVHGYCDSDGSNDYNIDLANSGCEAVISELISKGIPESKIRKVIHGESNPISNNKTEKSKALNRRVVVSVH
jgi:outer membrane protein OmpA-like peptidoglycan-associated protein